MHKSGQSKKQQKQVSAKENQVSDRQAVSGEAMTEKSISYRNLTEEEIKEAAISAFRALMDRTDNAGKEYLIASVAGALDATDELDRYTGLYEADAKLVKDSGWFDEKYYFSTNPNLPEETDAVLHYLILGYKENADPCAKFNTKQYKLDYPEVNEYDMCTLVYHLRMGEAEGKQPKASTKSVKKQG